MYHPCFCWGIPTQQERNLIDQTKQPASYRLAVETVECRVRAQIDGQVVADSSDVMFMYETYHPPQCYFPKTLEWFRKTASMTSLIVRVHAKI